MISHVKILDSFHKLELNEIVEFESRFDLQLPSIYRDFLLKNNGGFPSRNELTYWDDGKLKGALIDYFFGLNAKDNNYNLQVNWLFMKSRIPAGMLPIASDIGGNLILLSLRTSDYGEVFFWDHEQESDDENENNIFKSSDSFEQFVSNLK